MNSWPASRQRTQPPTNHWCDLNGPKISENYQCINLHAKTRGPRAVQLDLFAKYILSVKDLGCFILHIFSWDNDNVGRLYGRRLFIFFPDFEPTKNSDFDFPEISGKHTISGTQKKKPAASNRSPYRWVKADPWFSWARWEGGLTRVMCLSSLYLPYHKRSQLLLVGLGRRCCCCCCSNSCFECDIGFQIWTEIV